MNAVKIQQKAKYISDQNGKPIEVILPYNVYKRLIDLQISAEIYQQKDTQKSIQKAKEDIRKGNFVTSKNINKAIEWLEK